jgi:hypothetical protein
MVVSSLKQQDNLLLKKKTPLFANGLCFCLFVCLFFAVLGFELRTYTLSHSTSPFFVMEFFSR